ncbi:MAG: cobalamin-dependent protein [Planctomycetota bacterium]|nr:cobalamin-dependent protein [Planctomycetota bacterium]
MKTLLINPPMYDQRKYGKPFILPYGPPLGIAYLASTLEKHGFNVKALDMFDYSWDKVRRTLEGERPDAIGVTCLTEQRASPRELARLSKTINKDCVVIMGGIHSTIMYEQILDHWSVDIIILGEGEETIKELMTCLESKKVLGDVHGIAYKCQGKIVRTSSMRLIENLDDIPFPAYKYFDFDKYTGYEILEGNWNGKSLQDLRFVPIVSTRGCVGSCQFCSTPSFWQRWRIRSAKNVVDEMELLSKKFGCGFFNFADDIFTVNKNRVIDLCKEIINRKLDVVWDCETRVNFIWEDMLDWMIRAGCYCISFGVESASETVLKAIKKKTTPEQIAHAFKLTKQVGMKTKMLLMIGNPGENDKTVDDTVRMIEGVRPDFVSVSEAMVFPGTELYELAKQKGVVRDDYWLTDRPAPYFTAENSLEKLLEWSNRLMSANARAVWKWLRKLRNILERNTGLRVTGNGIEYLGNGYVKRLVKW